MNREQRFQEAKEMLRDEIMRGCVQEQDFYGESWHDVVPRGYMLVHGVGGFSHRIHPAHADDEVGAVIMGAEFERALGDGWLRVEDSQPGIGDLAIFHSRYSGRYAAVIHRGPGASESLETGLILDWLPTHWKPLGACDN